MAIEPDRIRVDLMKLKRKIFLSYPYGSRERKDFLLKNKLNEISFLSKMIPEESATVVFDAYKAALRLELLNIFIALCGGGCFAMMMVGFYAAYPKQTWLSCWYAPLIMGLCFAGSHVKHIIDQWQGIKPFQKEYEKIQEQIKKLRKDTKNLE